MVKTVVNTEPTDMKALVLSCFSQTWNIEVVIKIIVIKTVTSHNNVEFAHLILDEPLVYE
jgi:hypothetical protein